MIQKLKSSLWWFYNREAFLIMEDALMRHRQREDRYKDAIDYLLIHIEDEEVKDSTMKFIQTGEWV